MARVLGKINQGQEGQSSGRVLGKVPKKEVAQQGPTVGGIGKQFLVGLTNSAAFSAPEVLFKDEFKSLESNEPVERVARGVGTATGFVVGAPAIPFKVASKVAAKSLAKTAPKVLRLAKIADKTSKATAIGREARKAALLKASLEGAGGGALFAAVDPKVALEDKPEAILQNMTTGAVLGSVFQAVPQSIRDSLKKKRSTFDARAISVATGQKEQLKTPLTPTAERIIPKEQKSLLESLAQQQTRVMAAKRGIISNSELNKMSAPIKARISQNRDEFYRGVEPGSVMNAETMNAALEDAFDRLSTKGISSKEISAIEEQIIKLSSVTSEIGRSLGVLNRFRDPVGIKADYARKTLEKLSPDARKQAEKMFKSFKNPTFWDKLFEWRNAGLLSSPITQERNIIGNSIGRAFVAPEKVIAGGVDRIASFVSGKPRSVYAREGIADVVGMTQGFKPALRNALRALVDDSFVSNSRLHEGIKHPKAIGGVFGKVVRTPFRALNAMDEYFSTLSSTSSLYSSATRQAIREKAKDLPLRVSELVRDPTVEMIEKAAQESLKQTFRNPLGRSGASAQNFLRNSRVGSLIVPFFRTPVNLFKWTLDRGPFGVVSPNNWKALMAGSREEKAEAVARVAFGQVLSATMFQQAMEGNITGRLSSNKKERELKMAKGIQPYSIKIGDKWASYRSFEPISSWIAMVANAAEITKGKKAITSDKAMEIVAETLKMFKDQTFLRGISEVTNVLENPQANAPRFIQNMVGSVAIPAVAGTSYAARLADPIIREPGSIPESLKAKLPYFSKSVPAKLDIWGRPITVEGSLMERALLPTRVMTEKPDFTTDELLSLEKYPPQIRKNYRKLDMTVSERNSVVRVENALIKRLLDRATKTAEYQHMTPSEKESFVGEIFREVRVGVRQDLINPIFLKKYREAKTDERREELLEKNIGKNK